MEDCGETAQDRGDRRQAESDRCAEGQVLIESWPSRFSAQVEWPVITAGTTVTSVMARRAWNARTAGLQSPGAGPEAETCVDPGIRLDLASAPRPSAASRSSRPGWLNRRRSLAKIFNRTRNSLSSGYRPGSAVHPSLAVTGRRKRLIGSGSGIPNRGPPSFQYS